jgi:hypothetical protein
MISKEKTNNMERKREEMVSPGMTVGHPSGNVLTLSSGIPTDLVGDVDLGIIQIKNLNKPGVEDSGL